MAATRVRTPGEVAPTRSAVNAWRTTTAIRVFALALATGTVIRDDLVRSAPIVVVIMLLAAVMALLEWKSRELLTHWYVVGEAIAIPTLVVATDSTLGLSACLAYPAVIAGVRHGLVTTLNVTLVSGLAAAATLAASPSGSAMAQGTAVAPWLAIGLGVGLLASWQSRPSRNLAARQAPYAAAHQLMARIHQLASAGDLGLDSTSLAGELDAAMRSATGGARSTVFVLEPDNSLRALNGGDDVERLAAEIAMPDVERTPGAAVVPLRGAQQVLGYCVVVGVPRWTPELDQRAHEVAAEFAIRLDTAVLFDNVRALATSEERNRIARDMHDGVAQEIVGLGYIVDEIESLSDNEQTKDLASSLRAEITRLVSEIRFSIFDLRQQVMDERLSGTLADYAREVSDATGLRVHLMLDESGPPLPRRTATEVLRVAQEAIGNARRHAHAENLWVTFESDGAALLLRVEDDGVGKAAPRDHHWGMQTMRERAEGVGACFDVWSRTGGGTVISMRSPTTATQREGTAHEHHRATG